MHIAQLSFGCVFNYLAGFLRFFSSILAQMYKNVCCF